jgi:hypothetical protein
VAKRRLEFESSLASYKVKVESVFFGKLKQLEETFSHCSIYAQVFIAPPM